MSYELTDEVSDILAKWFKDPIDKPCAYCEASKEVIAKLLKYQRDMTPEGLRKEIRQIFTDEILLSFWTHEKCPPNQQEIKGCQLESDIKHERCMPCWEKWLEALIGQILSLVIPQEQYKKQLLERLGGMKYPGEEYQGNDPETQNVNDVAEVVWDEAIQAVKDIVKEVG